MHTNSQRNDPNPDLQPAWQCPQCKTPIRQAQHSDTCPVCGWTLQVMEGVPILVADPAVASHDDLEHHLHGHKAGQAAHFNRTDDAAFEISRPQDTPALYQFLLAEKFRRGISPVHEHLQGKLALTVCGGSGMDAEYFARAGARVISSDLSLGAAQRARTRFQKHGLSIQSVVADVEHLPLADQSVDLVAVHDGLHHLADPYLGLAEMVRVAKRWVIVTEPARASITAVATRLGLALATEESGNQVARLVPSEVVEYLHAQGFRPLKVERYAMYYRHRPGRIMQVASLRGVFPIVRFGWRAANEMLGRFGNKMVVVAERLGTETTEDSGRGQARRPTTKQQRPADMGRTG